MLVVAEYGKRAANSSNQVFAPPHPGLTELPVNPLLYFQPDSRRKIWQNLRWLDI